MTPVYSPIGSAPACPRSYAAEVASLETPLRVGTSCHLQLLHVLAIGVPRKRRSSSGFLKTRRTRLPRSGLVQYCIGCLPELRCLGPSLLSLDPVSPSYRETAAFASRSAGGPITASGTMESAEETVTAREAVNDDELLPMSLDRDASDRTLDRLLALYGLLDDAAPMFWEGSSVPAVGVLLALPCLVASGLFEISRKLYGEIGPAFYGLRTTLLTLLLMGLLRIKRPEQLKEKDPAAFGRLLGLDRAPEVKTLRRRLTRLAAKHCAEQLGAELASVRVDQRGHLMGFLYVDGHVRAYHGQRPIASKAYVARRHLAMPASTDYWINDRSGDPLFVITGEANAALTK